MEIKWDTVIPADLKRTLFRWDIYVPLVTEGLRRPRVTEGCKAKKKVSK